jgi:hypothetical protein
MIQDRIDKIEAAVNQAPNLSSESRAQLRALLVDLKAEVASLAATRDEDARSIAGFADASVHEAIRTEKKPALAETALKGLTKSVEGFEASHPRLVQIVDRIAVTLSNMGI